MESLNNETQGGSLKINWWFYIWRLSDRSVVEDEDCWDFKWGRDKGESADAFGVNHSDD